MRKVLIAQVIGFLIGIIQPWIWVEFHYGYPDRDIVCLMYAPNNPTRGSETVFCFNSQK